MPIMKTTAASTAASVRTPYKTRRQSFLEMMNAGVPWDEWEKKIRPFYYESGKRGRPAYPLLLMLRMYLLQVWYNLSDLSVEEEIYDSASFAWFVGVNPECGDRIPDCTTLLRFRQILVENNLCDTLFQQLNAILEEKGIMMRGGTIVDATFIESTTSTKNKEHARDPEMHQAKKGKNWHHGMKSHIGVDAGSGLVHTATVTAANVSDVVEMKQLLREDDEVVYGDSGYTGAEKREEFTKDIRIHHLAFRINRRKGSVHEGWDQEIETQKSSVRSHVEHIFLIAKQLFGYSKVAYRGLKKNAARLFMIYASANILLCCRTGRLGAKA